MKRIGLTGGIATGKSTVARLFGEHGVPVISADAIVHELYANDAGLRRQIVKIFGPVVAGTDGMIDRTRLGERVFGDERARHTLEALVHPLVRQRITEATRQHESRATPLCLYDIPLLFESQYNWHFDAIIVASCSAATQLQRVMQRYQCDQAHAELRIGSQLPLAEKVERADYVVETEGALEQTRAQVEHIVRALGGD